MMANAMMVKVAAIKGNVREMRIIVSNSIVAMKNRKIKTPN